MFRPVAAACVSLLFVLFVSGGGSAQRITAPFNYGWRFYYGPEPGSGPGPNTCTFTKDVTNMTCTHMRNDPNRFNPIDCERACCYDQNCYVWQQGNKHCFHGGKDATCKASAGEKKDPMIGGLRESTSPPKTDYDYGKLQVDDRDWEAVDVPHDFVIEHGGFSPDADDKHGFINRNVSWYRKHFHVLPEWKGKVVQLYFEGVFHFTQVWVNGKYIQAHSSGYTGFTVRLDNITGLIYDDQQSNVIALRTDATFGSGHWYEGGGIYRQVHLYVLDPLHIVQDGLYVVSETEDLTSVACTVEVENVGAEATTASVSFQLLSADRGVVLKDETKSATIPADGTYTFKLNMTVTKKLEQWSIQSPAVYWLNAFVTTDKGDLADNVTTLTGFRSTRWDANAGFYLNGNNFNLRGFSHHNSMAGLGVVLSDRIHLFRVQTSKALGANIWRMSHNPYSKVLYDLLSISGTMSWDENRPYGLPYVDDYHSMTKRDRNSPSIVIWSHCNEYECEQPDNLTSIAFNAAGRAMDPTRPQGANGPTSDLDVQGFSHANADAFVQHHSQYPTQPSVLSECCSCNSQRDPSSRTSSITCPGEENSPGLDLPYVAGSLGVWTLGDYYGESGSWPSVSSSFGQMDLAYYPKAHAYWYAVNWLAMVSESDYGRPNPPPQNMSRVLDLVAELQTSSDGKTVTVTTLSSSNYSQLYAEGKPLGIQSASRGAPVTWNFPPCQPQRNTSCDFPITVDIQCRGLNKVKSADNAKACRQACCDNSTCAIWQYASSAGCWTGTSYNPSECYPGPKQGEWVGEAMPPAICTNITVVGRPSAGSSAIDSVHTALAPKNSSAVKMRLQLDVPSTSTSTGERLVLDGQDTALVRLELVSADGLLTISDTRNVTFSVSSGSGRLVGVANGDHDSHANPKGTTVPTYYGLARAAVQVTIDCLTAGRDIAVKVDVDAQRRTSVQSSCPSPVGSITVKATSPGLPDATVEISLSSDLNQDGPYAVAMATAKQTGYTYLENFQG